MFSKWTTTLAAILLLSTLPSTLSDYTYCDVCNDNNLGSSLRSHSSTNQFLNLGAFLLSEARTSFFWLQADSNLVVADRDNKPMWSSKSQNSGGNRLMMQDDGNLVLLTANDKPVWASQTSIIGEKPFCFLVSDSLPPTLWDSQCYALFSTAQGVYRPESTDANATYSNKDISVDDREIRQRFS